MATVIDGNGAIRPQIGVTNVNSFINTHDVDLTNGSGVTLVSQAPATNATWTNLSGGTPGATVDGALADAGFFLLKVEFAVGTRTNVRIPCVTTA